MANLTFDATNIDPKGSYEPLPPGEYKVQILQSEMRPTKNGGGQLLWLDMEVLEGPFQGRHVFDQLNLVNPNPTAVEIAHRTLSAICHAIGKLQVADTEELHFLPMVVRVTVERTGYNAIKAYKPVSNDGSTPSAPTPVASSPSPPQSGPATSAAAPWKTRG